jgi:vacuolar-type H+-ATPase subunit E/Vma4
MSETSLFTEDILTAARTKAQSIIDEAQAELERATQEAKASISKEAADIVRNAQAEAEAIKRRQTSEARHLSKLHEQQEKNSILMEVLDRTKKRIIDATKNETIYVPYLTSQIANGIRELGYDTAIVHLNATDLKGINRANIEKDAGKHLSKSVKVEWANEPIEAIGGAVISSSDGKTRIVNTLDQKFEALESTLLIEAGKSLFGK